MKKVLVVMVAVVVASAMGVIASIENSGHDFSGLGWNTGGEICQPCHTPHNATNQTQAPLWNHTNTAESAFGVYTSDTLNASVGQPDGESIACLSCHDGSVALDSFGGASGSTTLSGTKLIGTDLKNDHPVSFTYDTALATADGGLHNPTNAAVSVLLFSGKVQCSSCHDVHSGGTGNPTNLLVKSNAGSDLCLTCHDK